MFNIIAKDKLGKKLYINKDAQIQINLTSDKKDKFNFYELDESNGKWTYQAQKHTTKKNNKFNPSENLIQPQKGNENNFVLDLNFDVSSYKELDVFSGILWEYTGKHDSLDPRKNNINNVSWTDFNLEPTNEEAYEYFLTMNTKNKSFVTRVKASLQGEDFDIAMESFNAQKIEMVRKIDNLQKPFIRSIDISGFGTYNFDYIHKIEEPVKLLADFNFKSLSDTEHALIAVIYEKEDVVVQYPKDKWDLFSLDKKSSPKIIALLPNNSLAVYKGDIKKCFDKKKFTFNMKVVKNKIHSKSDLLTAIQNI